MTNCGVQSIGINCPMFKEGDNLIDIVVEQVLDTFKVVDENGFVKSFDINDNDIIGITESVVARTNGTYLTIADLVEEIKEKCPTQKVILFNPIYSRNRFAMILEAFAAACNKIWIVMPEYDEVGNPRGLNPNTGVNIMDYYAEICNTNNCDCVIIDDITTLLNTDNNSELQDTYTVWCALRPKRNLELNDKIYTLKDFGQNVNLNYGLLGSNKANETTLKLFPTVQQSMTTCYGVQRKIKELTGKHVEVMVYGDGCFKDATSGIWEFADPDVSPFYTEGLDGSPNEIKAKYFIDGKFANLSGEELNNAVKNEIKNKKSDLVGNMASQGTTPRKIVNLLASLMDLTSGSGDRCTPVVVVKNYL